ncbi:hypothetical protein JFL43_17740 [Viridibacillus sp. YIM B01967]|uniref:Uncharacterized protein n=1 Tax=Viridibacillus soli TaxID=2798301 RepID=A0ABS1HB80_9BACL|nr:hypothetical protein [Viridibacillus soli]MBK3496669.1 hypothetical protein [Viridibacillus soli]
MNKIKKFFLDNLRKVIAIVVYFVCIFILLFNTREDLNLITNIIFALFFTGLFVFLNMLMKERKTKK